jgi:UDP-N-acetylmuramoyl-tripeptide--D-alanyl-D-alanine ligase
VTLIDDSYNANPGSVAAAIDLLASMAGLRLLVLGDMAELGSSAAQWHQQVGRYAAERAIDGVFAVGELAGLAAAEAGGSAFVDQGECLTVLLAMAAEASAVTILVKGSRSAGMDKLCAQLRTEVKG